MRYVVKCAADFRQKARESLKGKWGHAIVAGLIAALLGATGSVSPNLEINFSENQNLAVNLGGTELFSGVIGEGLLPKLNGAVLIGGTIILLVALVIGVLYYILGSVVGVGYAQFNLDLVDGQKMPEIGTLFGGFSRWKTTAAAKFLRGLYAFLWTLLFIIPGILAMYNYAMTEYILAENPDLTADEAIGRSKEMMYGNRWRLFCLEISFIGWDLLCALTLGIGGLWLTPYKKAAIAAFYRDISGTEYTDGPIETEATEEEIA